MIVAGEKTEEYREIKGYWTVRLYDVFSKNPMKYLMDKKISGDIDYLKLKIRCNHFIALTPTSSLSTVTTRIAHVSKRRLKASASVSLRWDYVQTSGLILSFS